MPEFDPPPAPSPGDSYPVVGVGASAGGLEAFTHLLRHLPPRPGLAILFVQHLDPTRASMLAEILARETTLPVREATAGLPVEVNHVYVIPPDTRMGVDGGVIRLHPRGDRAALHLPVDFLFRSLAATFGPRAVAVVLSGGGTDGTLGVGAVREAGGLAFAQSEGTAGQTGMPASAAGGGVDAVLAPEDMAAALIEYAVRPELYGKPAPDGDEPLPGGDSLAPLFALLRERTGIDFGQYKQNTIRRRVTRRVAIQKFSGMDELVRAARDDPAELAALTRDLLIGVTRFFRDPGVFERLRTTALPALLRHKPDDAALRVWVPGCSTGEEVYTLAIVLTEAFGGAAEVPVKILATDVNEAALARARAGDYPENIVEDVSPERLRRHFRKTTAGYRVSSAVRDLCVFARHDLSADPPFARLDLISCRNVLIYFDAALQRRVLPFFHYALRPGGYLLLGQSEAVGPFADLFVPVEREDRLYTRTLAPARLPSGLVAGPPAWGRMVAVTAPPREAGGLADAYREADRVLARYAPVAVLVDDNLNILQFRGDSDPYLRHPSGTAGLDLLRMAREGLLTDLRDGIAEARAGGTAVRRPDVRVGEGDAARTVALHITPLAGAGLRCFVIAFEDAAVRIASPPPVVAVDESELAGRVGHLRRELEAAREHQQAVAEEYEAANEELKSAHEEVLASNEELQSTNEEMQTAREEMQSANEELETVNEELQHRNRELGRANDDLHSLLVGVNVPVVVVGRDLRIRRVTAQAEAAFGLLPADVGRTLQEVGLGLDAPDVPGTVARVIDSLEAAAFEARDRGGRWYSVRVRPYETGDNRIDGAVVTAVDVDAAKRAEAARRDLEARVFQAQKLESLGLMAGGVAHDLNNLLTPVLGYAHFMLAALPEESPLHPMAREVSHSARLAADLVQQLLSYSGMSRREVRVADLSELIRDMEGVMRRAANGTELRLESAGVPVPVEVDPAQVVQVAMNLVTNAAEAAVGGRGLVTVRTGVVDADRAALFSPYLAGGELPEGRYASLEVSDDGRGMNEETLARMFDPFYTTKFTGRGLGLAAVLGIIRGHQGTVRVQSEPGRGTTLRVLFPLSPKPVPAANRPPAADAATRWRGSGTVLVVDDESGVRGLVRMILAKAGFAVLEAATGEDGLRTFRSHAADVRAVLLDLTMPGMGGLATAQAIRAAGGTVPILVMSGYGPEETTNVGVGLRLSGFLQKPFVPESLLEIVQQVLDSPEPLGP